ncbi:hypothetical protein PDN14_26820 [Bacillus cereus group sp. Bc222]|uniref:hypothetical protein n=1 Tax=unclassified Bacillus cereus group TaxID=2750818 RepID=UPI001F582399|nr:MULTISPECIES: hypothetical protein [unclassified Bacillus cereus group]MDA2241987.1 hypothetical protein [Bacillus cereus group sp. Bc222]
MSFSPDKFPTKDTKGTQRGRKKKEPQQPIIGFDQVAGKKDKQTPSTENEGVKQEVTQTTEEATVEAKTEEPVVTETETPVTEEQVQEESVEGTENNDVKDDKSGNNEDKNEGESTPNSSENNDEGEEKVTQENKGGQDPNGNKTEEKDAVLSWLEEETKANKKQTKTYFLDKEVIDKIDKIGKKIPKAKGGTGGFVNELLKQALKDRNLW